MRHVSIAELKDHAEELVAVADAGEELVITLGGREYRLVAAQPGLTEERRSAMARMSDLREELRQQGVRVTRDEIKAWKNEGRH